jgi:hypothetical protein
MKSLKQSGRQQNLEGQEQEARGQVNDYVGGIGNRVAGTIGGAVAGITGNTAAQTEYQNQVSPLRTYMLVDSEETRTDSLGSMIRARPPSEAQSTTS